MARFLIIIICIPLLMGNYDQLDGDAARSKGDESLSKVEADILLKVETLGNYLAIIGDKKADANTKKTTSALILNMFYDSENATIEVSSLKNPDVNRPFSIKNYLKRLKLLPYEQVKIIWGEELKISTFEKQKATAKDLELYKDSIDINVGVVTISQRFVGLIDEQIIYTDFTVKDIQVIVLKIEKESGEPEYEIKLNHIKVVSTRR